KSDGRKYLDAEEKGLQEAVADALVSWAAQATGPGDPKVQRSKDYIARRIKRDDRQAKLPPFHGQQPVVNAQRLPEKYPAALDVEAAVAIEQADPLLRDDRTETEVAVLFLAKDRRAGLYLDLFFCHRAKLYLPVLSSR